MILVRLGLRKLAESGLEPDSATARTLIVAGGQIQDTSLVRDSWAKRVRTMVGSGKKLSYFKADWLVLLEACRSTGDVAFLQAHVSEHLDNTSTFTQHLLSIASRTTDGPTSAEEKEAVHEHDPDELVARITQVSRVVDAITAEMLAGRLRDFKTDPLPMGPRSVSIVGPQGLSRKVYDQLNVDAAAPKASSDGEKLPPPGSTGFSLAELRFENWKTINELLVEAETNSRAQQALVDDALKAGQPMARSQRPTFRERPLKKAFSSVHETEQSTSSQGFEGVGRQAVQVPASEWFSKVLRLRRQDPARTSVVHDSRSDLG